MGKLWLNNEIVDRLAMLQQTEVEHPGVNQVAIEKDWWVTVTLKTLIWQSIIHSLALREQVKVSERNYAKKHEHIFTRPFLHNWMPV